MAQTLHRERREATESPPRTQKGRPLLGSALTLQILETQEQRAIARRDFADARQLLNRRLELKAQILEGTAATAEVQS